MISDLTAVFMEFRLKANNDWDVLFKMFLIGEILFHVYSVYMYHSLDKYPGSLRHSVCTQWLPSQPDNQVTRWLWFMKSLLTGLRRRGALSHEGPKITLTCTWGKWRWLSSEAGVLFSPYLFIWQILKIILFMLLYLCYSPSMNIACFIKSFVLLQWLEGASS